jgi:transposase-like protein
VYCESERVVKNGKDQASGQIIQTYRCNDCGRRFNERSSTPMARLRTAPEVISMAMKVRSEGLGIRATRRVLEKSAASIITWEKRGFDGLQTVNDATAKNDGRTASVYLSQSETTQTYEYRKVWREGLADAQHWTGLKRIGLVESQAC